jgi:hypothetical protein
MAAVFKAIDGDLSYFRLTTGNRFSPSSTDLEVYILCMSPRNGADCVGNYCNAVLSGEIIAGRYVQLAVERNLDDNAQERGLHFATEIAGKVLRFVETVCTHQNE